MPTGSSGSKSGSKVKNNGKIFQTNAVDLNSRARKETVNPIDNNLYFIVFRSKYICSYNIIIGAFHIVV
jgi:hypothetical protein